MENSQQFKEGVPFYLEVYIDNSDNFDYNELVENIVENNDLIPGLKVSKIFGLGCSQDSMVCQKLEDDLCSLQEHINQIVNKYGNFQEDNLLDTLMTLCGKKPNEFGTHNEDRAEDIKRLIQNRDEIGLSKDGHYIKK